MVRLLGTKHLSSCRNGGRKTGVWNWSASVYLLVNHNTFARYCVEQPTVMGDVVKQAATRLLLLIKKHVCGGVSWWQFANYMHRNEHCHLLMISWGIMPWIVKCPLHWKCWRGRNGRVVFDNLIYHWGQIVPQVESAHGPVLGNKEFEFLQEWRTRDRGMKLICLCLPLG